MKQAKRAAPSGRAVAYIRVSTEEQADSGLGLEAQERSISAYCELHGLKRGVPHRDEGRSGSLPVAKRRGLFAALADLAPGDQLVIAKRDRLGRDSILVALLEREVEARGCRLTSCAGEGTEADDPGSILIRRIVDAISEHHVLVTKMRTREALAVKRSRNEWCGATPFGFRPASFGDAGQPATVERCPVEQAQLAEMRALRRAGLSPHAIARNFNERALPRTRPGKKGAPPGPWLASSISRILKNHPEPILV